MSIPSVAIADFASRIFERFDDKRVLVIGAGKMAQETLQYLTDAGAKTNRRAQSRLRARPSAGRAMERSGRAVGRAERATRCGRHRRQHHRRRSACCHAATIISEHVARRRHQRPLFVLDLAMPRDFEPAIGDELGVYLYGIDDLTEACERNREARASAAARRRANRRGRGPRVRGRNAAPRIGARSSPGSAKAWKACKPRNSTRLYAKLPELDDRSRREIQQFADRLVAKMLHPPLESLRDESRNGSPHGLLEALQRLFQLRDETHKKMTNDQAPRPT